MSVSGDMEVIGVVAGQDLSACQYKVVAVGGTIAAANLTSLGVLQNKPQSGEAASVAYGGHMKAYVGAAVTAGAKLKVTTSGWMITVTSNYDSAAIAMASANSGSLCEIVADFISASNI